MKTVIIDDNTAMHLIMKNLLAKFDDIDIIGSFQDAVSAYSFIMNNKIDLLILDIEMEREDGIEFARKLRSSGFTAYIVFVTSYEQFALEAFEVYATDYIRKPVSEARLKQTIERIVQDMQQRWIEEVDSVAASALLEPLTNREIDILRELATGITNKEIAQKLFLSEGTVKNHCVNIFGKMNVRNRVQAIALAKALKLLH